MSVVTIAFWPDECPAQSWLPPLSHWIARSVACMLALLAVALWAWLGARAMQAPHAGLLALGVLQALVHSLAWSLSLCAVALPLARLAASMLEAMRPPALHGLALATLGTGALGPLWPWALTHTWFGSVSPGLAGLWTSQALAMSTLALGVLLLARPMRADPRAWPLARPLRTIAWPWERLACQRWQGGLSWLAPLALWVGLWWPQGPSGLQALGEAAAGPQGLSLMACWLLTPLLLLLARRLTRQAMQAAAEQSQARRQQSGGVFLGGERRQSSPQRPHTAQRFSRHAVWLAGLAPLVLLAATVAGDSAASFALPAAWALGALGLIAGLLWALALTARGVTPTAPALALATPWLAALLIRPLPWEGGLILPLAQALAAWPLLMLLAKTLAGTPSQADQAEADPHASPEAAPASMRADMQADLRASLPHDRPAHAGTALSWRAPKTDTRQQDGASKATAPTAAVASGGAGHHTPQATTEHATHFPRKALGACALAMTQLPLWPAQPSALQGLLGVLMLTLAWRWQMKRRRPGGNGPAQDASGQPKASGLSSHLPGEQAA